METKTPMTDDTQQKTATGFGERLKKARESMHLSEKEAAARLHLNSSIIRILENESLNEGPPVTFLRGYLKSYARLLNISDQEINIALENLGLTIQQPIQTTTSPLMQSNNLYRSERYVHWLTYLIVLVILVMVGIWWNSHPHYSLQNTINSVMTQQSTPQPATQQTTIAVPNQTQPAVATTAAPPPTALATPATPAPLASSTANHTMAIPAPAPLQPAPAIPPAAPPTTVTQPLATAPAPVTTNTQNPAPTVMPSQSPGAINPITTPLMTQPGALPAQNGVTATDTSEKTAKHKKIHPDENTMLPEPGLEDSN